MMRRILGLFATPTYRVFNSSGLPDEPSLLKAEHITIVFDRAEYDEYGSIKLYRNGVVAASVDPAVIENVEDLALESGVST